MATAKKGILTATPSGAAYWVHLRRFNKRLFWKIERRAAKLLLKSKSRDG
jgi:hypothetical protein